MYMYTLESIHLLSVCLAVPYRLTGTMQVVYTYSAVVVHRERPAYVHKTLRKGKGADLQRVV
jgi:starvation-inducible outer membrane lipoprotein